VTFPVTIDLIDPPTQLKPGMNATAKIILASVTDALQVPSSAISGDASSGYTVQVAQNGSTANLETVKVTIGLANDSYTQIKSGLTAGETVVTGTVSSSSSSSSSSSGFNMGSLSGGSGSGMRNFNRGSSGSSGFSGGAPSGAPGN
jgi:macrolide-specific efflux system membrane fusion protein